MKFQEKYRIPPNKLLFGNKSENFSIADKIFYEKSFVLLWKSNVNSKKV